MRAALFLVLVLAGCSVEPAMRDCYAETGSCFLDHYDGCRPEDGFDGAACKENGWETCRFLFALCQVETATVPVITNH